MSGKVGIVIRHAKASLSGVKSELIHERLSVLDPNRERKTAFKEERWDGREKLYEVNGNSIIFPAGLAWHCAEHLEDLGYRVTIVDKGEANMEPLDFTRIRRDYLPEITLWDHQFDGWSALMHHMRATIKVPTGGGKTEILSAGCRYLWEEREYRSLIITSRRDLINQTVKRLNQYYNGDLTVGQLGDGVKDIDGAHVIVASAQTLLGYKPRVQKNRNAKKRGLPPTRRIPADEDIRDMLLSVETLWLDEAHHASSDSWFEIAQFCRAKRRYAMSGTPLKGEEMSDAKLIGAAGPLVYEVPADVLIEKGIVSKPKIVMVMSANASGPELPFETTYRTNPRTGKKIQVRRKMPYAQAYVQGIVENDHHNVAVVRAVAALVDRGRKVLVPCRRLEHYATLGRMLEEQGIAFTNADGKTSTDDREMAKHDFINSDVVSVMLSTTIFDEGTDVPGIDAMVLPEGVKINTNVIQRIGRAMRGKGDALIVDFVPLCHPTLHEHAYERSVHYEAEGYETVLLEDWPAMDDEDFDSVLNVFDSWVS